MKTYVIYYWKYNINARDYLFYIQLIKTMDIYHEIGKMICSSIENIKNIRYTELYDDELEIYIKHLNDEYHKISDNLYTKKMIKGALI